jgi:hypothetical protein
MLFRRFPTSILLWAALAAAVHSAEPRAAVAAALDAPWHQRSLVGMEVGPTGAQFGHSDPTDARYCARFDGAEIVRRCVAAGCEYVVMWARDGDYAYYDSKVALKCPGLGARDPLREAVQEARRHKLPIIAYCVLQQGGHFQQAHPELRMHGADGKLLGHFCFNAGYLDVMKRLVAEQLAYGVDGFHIDMPDQGFAPPYGCWCDACRRQFAAEFSRPMPKGVTWDEDWDRMLEFRYRSSERFEKALAAYIKSLNPRATVDFNYFGNPPFAWEVGQRPVQHANNADFVTGETGIWGFSALTVGLNAEFYRAATPGVPYQIAMQRGVRMYHDQTTRPLNDMRWELFTLLAHGAFVTMVDKSGFDGALDPVAYQRMGAALTEARSKRGHFGQQPIYEVGLYFSARTRDWIGRETPADYFQSFQGAHEAMVLEHIPYGVLLDESISLERLKAFPVVCLPNAAILSEREVRLLRQYVDEGGRLLVTGQSGQFDRLGKPLAASALSELVGAKAVDRLQSLDNWVRLGEEKSVAAPVLKELSNGIPTNWPFLVKGPAPVSQPTTAQAVGELLKPYCSTRQREGKEGTAWPMSAESPVGPAILVNRIGKGIVLTLAGSPDFATAGEHHIVEARRLLRNAVRFLHPNPVVEVTAPANVETVVTDDRATRTLRIHLLGYNPTPQTTPPKNRPYVLPGLIEDAPIFRASIEVDRPVKRVEAFNKTTTLRRDGQRIEAVVNDIHEVLLLSY